MRTTELTFPQHCLRLYVSDILRHRHRLPNDEILLAALETGVSGELLAAVALIERNRRPSYARLMENVVIWMNALLFALLGLPIRDATLGLFQLKISTAAELDGLIVVSTANWVRFKRRPAEGRISHRISVLRFIRTFLGDQANCRMAAKHIASLYNDWRGHRQGEYSSGDFLWFLGREYNDSRAVSTGIGFLRYGVILRSVLLALGPSRKPVCSTGQP